MMGDAPRPLALACSPNIGDQKQREWPGLRAKQSQQVLTVGSSHLLRLVEMA